MPLMLPYTKPPLPSDLKVWWKMDEANGDAIDVISGNNALQQGTVGGVTKGGQKCRGDFSASNYFTYPAPMLGTGLIYQLGSVWTIELDIYVDTNLPGNYSGIISHYAQPISGQNAELEWSMWAQDLATRAYIVNTKPPLVYLVGQKSNVLTPNVWHNLALVSDGTRLKTYTDGQLNPDELFMPAQMELIFGWIGRWLGTDGLINGYLKNIKIWNTAKTVFPTVVV